MERLKTIYLDTSELGKLASDMYARGEYTRNSSAKRFIEKLFSFGYVPFVSHHQMHELLAYENNDVVEEQYA